jgi:hypothetical protein
MNAHDAGTQMYEFPRRSGIGRRLHLWLADRASLGRICMEGIAAVCPIAIWGDESWYCGRDPKRSFTLVDEHGGWLDGDQQEPASHPRPDDVRQALHLLDRG